MEYIIREDNTQKVYLTESTLNIYEILKNYRYINESMKKEGFKLKTDECNLFKELLYENKVVGFCSYDFTSEFLTAALNNIYIIPEFRGKNILKNELLNTMEKHYKPSIIEPTHSMVETLIEYGFAEKITENIIASGIEFVIPGFNVETNYEYNPNEELSTHFYDLNISASIHFLNIEKCHIAYSSTLNYDIIHNDAYQKRQKLDDKYFEDMKKIFVENEAEITKTIKKLENKLPIKKYSLEEIIGSEFELSEYMETLIEDSHISHLKALEVKEQIKEEYEQGKITDESLLIRLDYLFKENKTPTIKSHKETCPYCNMPIDEHDSYCHYCGFVL